MPESVPTLQQIGTSGGVPTLLMLGGVLMTDCCCDESSSSESSYPDCAYYCYLVELYEGPSEEGPWTFWNSSYVCTTSIQPAETIGMVVPGAWDRYVRTLMGCYSDADECAEKCGKESSVSSVSSESSESSSSVPSSSMPSSSEPSSPESSSSVPSSSEPSSSVPSSSVPSSEEPSSSEPSAAQTHQCVKRTIYYKDWVEVSPGEWELQWVQQGDPSCSCWNTADESFDPDGWTIGDGVDSYTTFQPFGPTYSTNSACRAACTCFDCSQWSCLHVKRTDVWYEDDVEIVDVQEFDIYGPTCRLYGGALCRWCRGGGDDDTLAVTLNEDGDPVWCYSFFGGASDGCRGGLEPFGTYVWTVGSATYTAEITECEEESMP